MKTTIFLLYALALLLHSNDVLGFTIPTNLQTEGHAIVKRFAEHGFEDHDIAAVLIEKQWNTFHRIKRRDLSSVTEGLNDDINPRLRLEFSSGAHLHLKFKKRFVVNSETKYQTRNASGIVKRSSPTTNDCYATGHISDKPDVTASVSLCNGLHGIVAGDDIEYYIHPVEVDSGDHHVHILSRKRRAGHEMMMMMNDSINSEVIQEKMRQKRKANQFEAWKTEKDLTIEMALFTDAKYWSILHKMVPGREDEYLLITMAAVNALYGDPEKVGYNVFIKVKLIEHWEVDPDTYDFAEDVHTNLRRFCATTRDGYNYDMLFLHTSVKQNGLAAVGFAFISGVCTHIRCASISLLAPNRQVPVAHEIGHNLGFAHSKVSKCPDDIKKMSGSFMGGTLNFSPCNRWELQKLFETGKGACLFEETGKMTIEKKFANQPRVFPGQSRSPDDLCALYAGKGYKYFRPYDLSGEGICWLFMCQFEDNENPAHGHIITIKVPSGFPCGNEMFCTNSKSCQTWDGAIGWDLSYLRENKNNPFWSPWSKTWSKCSRECGTGVQIKERKCQVDKGMFLSPYCQGQSVKARLCNRKPCSGDPETAEEVRQFRGDEKCKQFVNNNVLLKVKDNSKVLPVSKKFASLKQFSTYIASKSCILSCVRDPDENGNIDGTMISGTPCSESTRSEWDLERFKIEMRCVNGRCMEFSSCPENEPKDACGICGGDESRCVVNSVTEDVGKGERVVAAEIPAGSKSIDLQFTKKGAHIELWDRHGQLIIGKDGEFPKGKYIEDDEVQFAGVKWSYIMTNFIRSQGEDTTKEDVVVKLLRMEKPLGTAIITYIKPHEEENTS